MVDVEDFLTDNGVVLNPNFNIQTLTGVSDDGRVMVGIGMDVFPPWNNRWFIIRIDETASITVPAEASPAPSLVQILPNPTRRTSTFTFDVTQSGNVGVDVYDSTGRLVRRLLDESRSAGQLSVQWDGRDDSGRAVPSGIYFYRLETDTTSETHKLTIVR
jgi:hypothetical protein